MRKRLSQLLVTSLLVSCGPAAAPRAPSPAAGVVEPGGGAARDTTCDIAPLPGPAPAPEAETLSVALPGAGPVDPAHAPVPANDAERLVFPQLYETLVRIDCVGRVVPGLAARWVADSSYHPARWTFTLRDDARFWDGAPVTASEVLAAWRARDALLGSAAAVLSPRELRVDDSRPLPTLSQEAYAVTKPSPDRGWPIGTGGYWISGATATSAPVIQPVGGRGGAAAPVISFRDISGADPRDFLDQGVGLLFTDDPAVVSYAEARPGLAALRLPWDRRYVLVVPAGEAPAVDRADLAGAVHAEARPDSEPACVLGGEATAAHPVLPLRRLLYDRTDRTARELAERLVGRGALGAGIPASGLAPGDLAAAVRSGTAWAYVTGVPSHDGCETGGGSEDGSVRALIAVRRYAVARRGFPRVSLDADGTIRIVP